MPGPTRSASTPSRQRRDSFCGKLSICNNLKQYGIPYTVGNAHVPISTPEEFRRGAAVVRGRLPRGARAERRADREHRRADHARSRRCATARSSWRPAGSAWSPRASWRRSRRSTRCRTTTRGWRQSSRSSPATCPARRTSPGKAMKTTAKLGVVLESWVDEYQHQRLRHPVLVRHAGCAEDLPLLHHEHDERRAASPPPARWTSWARSRCTRCSSPAAAPRPSSTGTTTTGRTRTSSFSSTAATRPSPS